MVPMLQSAVMFVFAALAFLIIGSLATALATNQLKRRLATWEPSVRCIVLIAVACTPLVVSMVFLLCTSLPSLLSLVDPDLDHCLTHDDSHAHLCFVHLPQNGVHKGAACLLLLGLVYPAIRGLLAAARAMKALRLVALLSRTCIQHPEKDVRLVETSKPFCFAAGFIRPQVFLSRGLLNSLNEKQLSIVLAHELAHVRRRDVFVVAVVRVLACFHLPAVATWLTQEIELASEQACDEEAAIAAGDRLAVASTIVTVAQAVKSQDHSVQMGALAFGELAIERRVHSLLAEPYAAISLRPYALRLASLAALALAGSYPLHHLTESALSVIAP